MAPAARAGPPSSSAPSNNNNDDGPPSLCSAKIPRKGPLLLFLLQNLVLGFGYIFPSLLKSLLYLVGPIKRNTFFVKLVGIFKIQKERK